MKNDNTDAMMQFITSKGNVEALLRNMTAIVNDHLGYSPDEITWEKAGTMDHLQIELEELAHKIGLDVDEILDSE